VPTSTYTNGRSGFRANVPLHHRSNITHLIISEYNFRFVAVLGIVVKCRFRTNDNLFVACTAGFSRGIMHVLRNLLFQRKKAEMNFSIRRLLFAYSMLALIPFCGCANDQYQTPTASSHIRSQFAKIHDFGSGADACGTGQNRLTLVDSMFYGTSYFGGQYGMGTVFSMDPQGHVMVLHNFGGMGDAKYGYYEIGPVFSDGWLYGSAGGGSSGGLGETPGILFRIRPDGTDYSILYTAPAGNMAPISCVVNGWVYACLRGASEAAVFRIRTDGSNFTTLHDFSGSGSPTFAPILVPSSWTRKATLIGAVQGGGASGRGMIYRMALDGSTFTVLHEFNGADGLAGGPDSLSRTSSTAQHTGAASMGT